MSTDESRLSGCRPILCVESVARSIAYYVDALGFHVGWSWSDAEQRLLRPGDRSEPTFAPVEAGGAAGREL